MLSCITGWLSSHQIAHLCFCGDPILFYKLQHGGVEHFWHQHDRWHPYGFPTFVAHFSQLRTISLDLSLRGSLPAADVLWDYLPSSLKSIDILSGNYSSFLTDASSASRFPLLESFSSESRSTEPLDWSHVLPTLTSLKLHANLCTAEEADTWSLDVLPRNLTCLQVGIYPGGEFRGDWPPFLTDLRIALSAEFTAWPGLFAGVPNALRLEFYAMRLRDATPSTEFASTVEDWAALPPSLTDLFWPTYICNEYNDMGHGADWNDEVAKKAAEDRCAEKCSNIFKALPPGLTRLSINPFSEHAEILAHLPPNIRILEGFSITLNEKTASLLPRSVVRFSNLAAPTDAVPFLPRTIANLTLFRPLIALAPFMEHRTEEDQQTIASPAFTPTSSTDSLVLRRKDRLQTAIETGIVQMKSLKEVNLKVLTFNFWRFPFSTVGQSLPPTLEDLTLSCTLGTEDDEFPSAVPDLTEKDMSDLLGLGVPLTPRLQSLRIRLSLQDSKGLLHLPPSLTKLELSSIKISSLPTGSDDIPSAPQWTQLLPRDLKRIKTAIDDDAVSELEKPGSKMNALLFASIEPPNLDWWKYMPKTLVSLDLSVSHFGISTMKDLTYSSPELSVLRLRITMRLDCRWLEDLTFFLPKQLEELVFDIQHFAFVEIFPDDSETDPAAPQHTPAKHLTVQKPLNLIDSAFLLLPRRLCFMQFKRHGFSTLYKLPPGAPVNLNSYACSPAVRVTERPAQIPKPTPEEADPRGLDLLLTPKRR